MLISLKQQKPATRKHDLFRNNSTNLLSLIHQLPSGNVQRILSSILYLYPFRVRILAATHPRDLINNPVVIRLFIGHISTPHRLSLRHLRVLLAIRHNR